MRGRLVRAASLLGRPFNRDKDRRIRCPSCDANTRAEFFRCERCRAWTRSPFPQIATLVLLLLAALSLLYYYWRIIPTMAELAAGVGRQLPLPIQLTVWLSNAALMYGTLFSGLPAALATYAAFLWRPHRQTGPYIVLSAALALTLGLMAVYLFSLWHMEALVLEALARRAG